MSDRIDELESKIGSLTSSLSRLRDRVAALEDALEPRAAAAATVPSTEARSRPSDAVPEGRVSATADESSLRAGARLTGGVLLVIAGGYLLRALTETGALPQALGVGVGLAYALVWAVACHVLGDRGRLKSAAANGIATALLAFPLLWEAAVRFEILSPWVDALLTLGVGATLLLLARRHGLASLAWVTILALGVTCLAAMFGTRSLEPYALVLVVLGLGAAGLGSRHGALLPWLAYGFADLGALLLILGSLGERPVTQPSVTLPILVVTFLGFLSIFVHRTWRSGDLALDEPIQGTLATLLGFGGALLVGSTDLPSTAPWLASLGVLLGICGYLVLSTSVGWSREHRWPYLLYSSLALGILAMGVVSLFSQPAWVFSGLAVVLAGVGVWLDRTSPGLHAAMSILLAAITSGLAGMTTATLVGGADAGSLSMPAAALATAAASLVCALLPLKVSSPVWPSWLPRLGRAAVILVVVLGVDALLLRGLLPTIVGGADDAASVAAAAALRTGIAALLIIALALASHWRPLQPASWLVYPLLAVAGLKLVLVDFPQGRAITMAIALLMYGGALILAPRWNRLRESPSSETSAAH